MDLNSTIDDVAGRAIGGDMPADGVYEPQRGPDGKGDPYTYLVSGGKVFFYSVDPANLTPLKEATGGALAAIKGQISDTTLTKRGVPETVSEPSDVGGTSMEDGPEPLSDMDSPADTMTDTTGGDDGPMTPGKYNETVDKLNKEPRITASLKDEPGQADAAEAKEDRWADRMASSMTPGKYRDTLDSQREDRISSRQEKEENLAKTDGGRKKSLKDTIWGIGEKYFPEMAPATPPDDEDVASDDTDDEDEKTKKGKG